jgi:rubrerythrin
MPILKSEPAGRLSSMGEFFTLARAMGMDAVRRYTQAAEELRRRKSSALADIFDALSKVERERVEQVAKRAAEHTGATMDVTAEAPWAIPDTFDVSPEEIVRTNLMTPYRALALAVRHEERSFAFWTYVAAHADGEVKAAAERMALEELEHVSLLRRERRKAFHSARRAEKADETTLSVLAAAERRLANLIDDRHKPRPSEEFSTFAIISRDAAVRLDALEKVTRPKFSTVSLPADRRNDIAALSEYLAEAYLRLAESARNEQVLVVAQELAATAIDRLRRIRRLPVT